VRVASPAWGRTYQPKPSIEEQILDCAVEISIVRTHRFRLSAFERLGTLTKVLPCRSLRLRLCARKSARPG
jgi:hypothetical protein